MNRSKAILVLLSGASLPSDLSRFDQIFCADSGYLALIETGIKPSLIIGDMDSLSESTRRQAEADCIPLREFPAAKDTADGELAISEAIACLASEIIICGGRDGRLDHVLSCHTLLNNIPAEIRAEVRIGDDRIYLLREGESLTLSRKNPIISLMPVGREAKFSGVGLRWNTTSRPLIRGATVGIHNEIIGAEATITATCGDLYLLALTDDSEK